MPEPREITINSRKYDGSIRKTWKAALVSQGPELLIAVGIFQNAVEHNELGAIVENTFSFEYFWPNRWYNVFRFHTPDGAFRNFYCNIAMPPSVNGDVLDFIDLDIDVVIWPNGQRDVLDLEDFEENSRLLGYSEDVRFKAMHALDDLLRSIEAQEFPFDQTTNATINDI